MCDAEQIRQKLDDQWLSSLSGKYNLKEVILFGSILTDSFHEESDIDIAIIGTDKLRMKDILDIELSFETLLQRRIDVIDLMSHHIDIFLKIHILDTGECIYTADTNEKLESIRDEIEDYYRKNREYFERRRRDVLC